jgi:hypothetical protein
MRRLVSNGAVRLRAVAIAAAAAVAAVVIGLSGVSGAPGLVDRADGAINIRDQVLHEVDVTDYRPNRYGDFYDRTEGWQLPANGEARVIDVMGYERARYVSDIIEWIITATGRVFERTCFNYCRSTKIGSFINGRSRWTDEGLIPLGALGPPILPGTYTRELQAAYRVHAAVPKGMTTFAGKRVNTLQSMEAYAGAVLVSWRPGTPPPARVRDAGRVSALVAGWLQDVGLRGRPPALV